MLVDIKGDMLKLAPKGSLVGIPVNTVGVAGKGLACYMRERWKKAHEHYVKACRRGRIATGELVTYEVDAFTLAFLPTKYHWPDPSVPDLIKVTLARLDKYMEQNLITECHIPRIGCGETTGTLDYRTEVRPLIEARFGDNNVTDTLYVYDW